MSDIDHLSDLVLALPDAERRRMAALAREVRGRVCGNDVMDGRDSGLTFLAELLETPERMAVLPMEATDAMADAAVGEPFVNHPRRAEMKRLWRIMAERARAS